MSDKKLKTPVLEDISRDAIRNFLRAFEVYRRTGKKTMIDLIASEKWSLLRRALSRRAGFDATLLTQAERVDVATQAEANEACKTCLRAFCAPPNPEDALSHFDNVYLDSVKEEKVLQYLEDFEIRARELTAANSTLATDPAFLLRIFETHVRHTSLRADLRAHRPTTFMEASADLMMWAEEWRALGQGSDKPPKQNKGGAAATTNPPAARRQEKTCKRHPNSHTHTWEECRSNPKNNPQAAAAAPAAAASPAKDDGRKGKPAAAAWNRPPGQRLERSGNAKMLRQQDEDEDDTDDEPTARAQRLGTAAATATTDTTSPTPESAAVAPVDVPQPMFVPRYVPAIVHTKVRPQRHVAFADTGSDVNIVNRQTAMRLLEMGCERADPQIKTLVLADSTKIKIDSALQLDVTLSSTDGQLRTNAVFVIMDAQDDLVLGYKLLNELARHAPWWTSSPLPACPATSAAAPAAPDKTEPMLPRVVFDNEPEAKQQMLAFLSERRECFRKQGADDKIDMPPVEIKLIREPRRTPMRKIPLAHQQFVRNMIQEWLDSAIIQPSTSPYSNPLVLIKKKSDGAPAETAADAHRLCLDLRVLNECIADDPYPMPIITELLDIIVGRAWYAKLDIRSAFLQVPLSPATSRLFAFTTPDGHWEMLRLPFGVKTSPAIWQRIVNEALAGLLGVICVVYMDDCCVFGDTSMELAKNVQTVIDRLDAKNIILKASKCDIGLTQIDYLGHIVSSHGLTMAPERTHAFAALPTPHDKRQLLSFLGAAAWFRRFIPQFAMITQPLYALTHKDVEYHWGEQQAEAFTKVKAAVVEHAMLFCFTTGLPTILRTDASNVGMGAMLVQIKEDQERPIGFFSRAFSSTERLYSTVEQEALGIVSAAKHFHHYLIGHHFTIETDSKNNTFIHTCNNPKVLRWRMEMLAYDYEIRHIAGRDNPVSDHCSRAFRIVEQSDKIERVHSDVVGHMGITQTLKRLEDEGWRWPTMRQDVTTFIQQCAVCAKTRLAHPALPMEPRTVEVWEPFESVSVDFVGPMPKDGEGNTYIVCCIDNFTRFVELTAVKDCTAFSAAKALLLVFARYGAPLEVRSDQGRHFAAEIIRQFLALCDVRQRFSLAYHPQANGIVERAIKECNRHLRAIVNEQRVLQNWSDALPLVQRIMNACPHSATGAAPAILLYGKHCNLNRNLFSKPAETLEIKQVPEYLRNLLELQTSAVDAAQRHQAETLDARLNPQEDETETTPTVLAVGQTVLLRPAHDRPASKLAPRMLGPYRVLSKTGTNSYKISLLNAPATEEPIDVHLERLVPYTLSPGADADDVIAADRLEEYLVEKIEKHRRIPGKRGNRASAFQFLVKWKGYDNKSWEPSSSFTNNSIFNEYLISHDIEH